MPSVPTGNHLGDIMYPCLQKHQLLRASIAQTVLILPKAIIGIIHAGRKGIVEYAAYVEFRWDGKYAYLWPGIMDMKKRIWDLLYEGAKKGLKK